MSFLNSIWGSKPKVPELAPLDLGKEQGKAIANNQAALPAAEKLTGAANLFNRDQITQMLESVTPDFMAMTRTASTNIESMLKGEIPEDVSGAVTRSAAAKALGGGFGGSGMHGDLVARDLGLTSLDLTQRGLASSESWLKTMDSLYAPGMMSVQSMFVTPMQQAGFDTEERNAQFQRQWMQNQVSAMPDPVASGIEGTIYGLASAYLGGSGDRSSPYKSAPSGGGVDGGGSTASWADAWGMGGGGEGTKVAG